MSLSQSLIAFAFVQQTLEQGGDIIEALAPIFAPIAQAKEGRRFKAEEFAKLVENEYGLEVHPYVAEDWAPRLASGGILIADDPDSYETEYTYARTELPPPPLQENDIEDVLRGFQDFVSTITSRLGIDCPPKETLDKMFFDRVKEMAFDDIRSKSDRELKDTTTLSLAEKTAPPPDNERSKNARVLGEMMDVAVASFIIDAREKNNPVFETINEISVGALAAEIALSFRVAPKSGDTFKDKVIFFDTPLVLDLLEFGSREEGEFSRLLFDGLRNQGAQVAIYSHCVDEFTSVLKATLENFDSKNELTGPLGARFRTEPGSLVRARDAHRNPARTIKKYDIGIVQSGTHDQLKFFSNQQETDLLGEIRPFSLGPLEARVIDTASIAAMIRYCVSQHPRGGVMNHARMFVTKNVPLAQKATQIMKRDAYLADDSDPPIITDRFLGGLLWLAQGGQGAPIPHSKLIANCAAAIQPRRDVLKSAQDTLARLDPDKAATFEAMMSNDRCSLYLMRDTLGSAQLINDSNISSLFEEVRKATAHEIALEKDEEASTKLSEQKELYEARLQSLDDNNRLANERTKKAETRADELGEKLDRLASEKDKLYEEIARDRENRRRSDESRIKSMYRKTEWIKWCWTGAIILVLGCVTYVLSSFTPKGPIETALYIIAGSAAAGIVFWDVPDRLFGPPIRRRREKALKTRMETAGLGHRCEELEILWSSDTIQINSVNADQS